MPLVPYDWGSLLRLPQYYGISRANRGRRLALRAVSSKRRLCAMTHAASNEARGARREYRAALGKNTALARAIERAIQLLAPGAWNATIAAELLEARASPDTLRDWRRGRRNPPAWALDLLRARLEAQARPSLEAIASLNRAAPAALDRGAYGTRALNRWRAQKQKPAV